MQTLRIAVLFALLLISQVHCRPDKITDDKDYAGDTPDDDGEDEDDDKEQSSGPVDIRSRPLHLEVKPGSRVDFPCAVVNADDYAVQWKKDNVDLYFGGTALTQEPKRIVLSPNFTLTIYDVTPKDSSDQYSCSILTDPVKQINHTLRVVDSPKELWEGKSIRTWPQKTIDVNEGDSVKFGCETNLESKPEIKWSHKGERLHYGEIVEGNYVTIKKVNRHNSGRYQCVADDGSEHLPNESVEIIVKYAPVIEVEHESVHTGTGMTSEITCKVHAHPHAKVTWLRNGKSISGKKDKKHMTEEKSLRTLVIEHTTKHDLGNYTCLATNIMGEASKDIELTGKPGKPKFIGGIVNDDDSSFTLKWKVESFSPITQYLLEYRAKGDVEWKKANPKVTDGKGNQFFVEYPLTGLLAGSYETTLLAQNDYGWSPRSTIHTFRKEYSANEPQNVKGGNSNASTTRPFAVFAALFLVVASCVSTRL